MDDIGYFVSTNGTKYKIIKDYMDDGSSMDMFAKRPLENDPLEDVTKLEDPNGREYTIHRDSKFISFEGTQGWYNFCTKMEPGYYEFVSDRLGGGRIQRLKLEYNNGEVIATTHVNHTRYDYENWNFNGVQHLKICKKS